MNSIDANRLVVQMREIIAQANAHSQSVNHTRTQCGNLFNHLPSSSKESQQMFLPLTAQPERDDPFSTPAQETLRHKFRTSLDTQINVRGKFVFAYKEIMDMPV